MSVENPIIVGFDGLHRAGKSTQARLLRDAIEAGGGSSLVMRGDGTRDGLGLHAGDPYSEEWQQRGRMVKSPAGNTIENWNAASLILMRELLEKKRETPRVHDALIVDRTVLSRVAFLLHRGAVLEGERLSIDDLYPASSETMLDVEDIAEGIPDVIFELEVPSPATLLDRLEEGDPKHTFRARNIRGGFYAASLAKEHLPHDIEDRVVTMDATEDTDVLHERVKQHLQSTALAHFWT